MSFRFKVYGGERQPPVKRLCKEAFSKQNKADSLHLCLPCSGINLDLGLCFSGLNSPFLWIQKLLRAHCRQDVIPTCCAIKNSKITAEQWSWSLKHQRKGMPLRAGHWASALWPLRIKPNTPKTIYQASHVSNPCPFPNLT